MWRIKLWHYSSMSVSTNTASDNSWYLLSRGLNLTESGIWVDTVADLSWQRRGLELTASWTWVDRVVDLSWQSRGLELTESWGSVDGIVGLRWLGSGLELKESIWGLNCWASEVMVMVFVLVFKEWLFILLIRPPFLSRASARHTPMPTPISYSVIFLQSAFVLTASGKGWKHYFN